jgi:Uncharacterised nucleotidyltransferase
MSRASTSEAIEATLKKAAAALRDAGTPFMLGGSLAVWARGGPRVQNDLDLVVRPEDAERALRALEDSGMRPEDPPEEWLVKAYDGDVLVDLIHGPEGLDAAEAMERAEEMPVLSIAMKVMRLEDVMYTKLMSLDEHGGLDYGSLLHSARSLRERIDWDDVRSRSAHSPYAKAFFTLLEELGVLERRPGARPERGVQVSVAEE